MTIKKKRAIENVAAKMDWEGFDYYWKSYTDPDDVAELLKKAGFPEELVSRLRTAAWGYREGEERLRTALEKLAEDAGLNPDEYF